MPTIKSERKRSNIFLEGSFSSRESNILNLSPQGLKFLSEAAICKLWEKPFASVSRPFAHSQVRTHKAPGTHDILLSHLP